MTVLNKVLYMKYKSVARHGSSNEQISNIRRKASYQEDGESREDDCLVCQYS